MPTYTSNFLSSKSVSGTPDVYATAKQDYTGLTLNGTDLVLGQGYFANFDTTADPLPALSSASWAGLGFFSEELSTDAVWEPKGSYFLSETACVVPSADESQRVGSRLLRISSGTLYAFYVGGSSTTNLTVGATVNSHAISFRNSQTLATTDAANTDEANIAYIIRRVKQNTEIAPFRYSGSLITSGQVGSITVTNPGSGYTSVPTVTISGGGSSSASATAVLSGTTVGSITVTNPGNGYTSAPTVTISGGGGSRAAAVASLFPNLNLQNIMMASEGATDKDSYKYEITPQKAVVSRSIGDLYTFNYPKTDNTAKETYDFATGGDGVVAIGATDSFVSVSEHGASDSAFTAAPFGGSSTGNFNWPATSEIQISDAGFLYSDLKKIFKTRSYGHSYNMALGLNFDLGTNDGNDINLATNWSYSDFFRGDAANRYAAAAPTSGGSGWKIQPTFDTSVTGYDSDGNVIANLTEVFPISGINETTAVAFVNIKNLFAAFNEPAVWIASLVGLCNDKNHPTPANASALTDWESIPFAAPVGGDPAAALITTANFKDYSDVNEADDLLSEFGLDATCLSTERSLGTAASYTKGNSHSIWENKTGTSSVETKFPAPESDGGWGYWESSDFDKLVSYSQTGTVKATTNSDTKVSSDVIGKEMTNTAHGIDFGYTYVPIISFGINLQGVKTTFGHTPPTKVDIDFGLFRSEITAVANKNVIKFSSIINGSNLGAEVTKTTVSGVKTITHISPIHNFLGGGIADKNEVVPAKVKGIGIDVSADLVSSCYTLARAKSAVAGLKSAGAQITADNTAALDGIAMGAADTNLPSSSTTPDSGQKPNQSIRSDDKTEDRAAPNAGGVSGAANAPATKPAQKRQPEPGKGKNHKKTKGEQKNNKNSKHYGGGKNKRQKGKSKHRR